jgi:hypothetical protein
MVYLNRALFLPFQTWDRHKRCIHIFLYHWVFCMSDTSIYFSHLYFTRSSHPPFWGISRSWAFTIAFTAFSIDSLSVASDGLLACRFCSCNLSSSAFLSFFYINYIQSLLSLIFQTNYSWNSSF